MRRLCSSVTFSTYSEGIRIWILSSVPLARCGSRGCERFAFALTWTMRFILPTRRESRLEIRREPRYDTPVCGWRARARVGARVRRVLWERVAKHGNMPATHLSQRGLPSCISERNARVSIQPRTDHEVSAVAKTLPIYVTDTGIPQYKAYYCHYGNDCVPPYNKLTDYFYTLDKIYI